MRRLHPFVALAVILLGCRPNPELAALPGVDDHEGAAAEAPSLEAFADAMDPGPQARLTEDLPPWMFEMLGLRAEPTEPHAVLLKRSARAQADVDVMAKEGLPDDTAIFMAIRATARSLVMAEQAAAEGPLDGDTLARLERVYSVVDVPLLASDRSTFGQIISLFARQAAAEGKGPADAAQYQQLAGVVQRAIRAAGPLHRHTVAELIRNHPDHEGVPTALLAAANARRGTQDDWPVPAAKVAVRRRGDAATGPEQLSLARVCYAALDLACGDAALEAAGDAEHVDAVKELGALATRIVALEGEPGFDAQLERARAQLALGRHFAAKSEFEALRASAPDDARPVAGLARLAIETELDFIRAAEIIDGAGPLENADEDFYELAIGSRATAALTVFMPRAAAGELDQMGDELHALLERMQRDAAGYAALGNPDGRFLQTVFDVTGVLLAQYEGEGKVSLSAIPDLTARIAALQSKIPNHGHSYRLLMSASLFEPDRGRAVAATGTRAPEGDAHDELAARRARALCDLAVTWSDGALAEQCLQASRDLPRSPLALGLQADALVTTVQLTGKVSWLKVGQAYEAALDDDMTPEDARALNNVAMALWEMGNLDTAVEAWTLSAQLAEEFGGVPQLNLLVARSPEGSPQAIAALEGLMTEDRKPAVRIAAMAWLATWTKGKKAKATAEKALAEAIAEEAKTGMRPTPPDPHSGLLLEGTLQASFGYAVKDGLQIQLDASGLPWAFMAPPR